MHNIITNFARFLLITMPIAYVIGRAPGDIILSLIAILFLTRSISIKDYNWISPLWVKIFLIFWAWIIIRAIFTTNIQVALGSAFAFGRYGFFAIAIAYWLLPHEKSEKYLWISAIIGCCFISFNAIYQYIVGVDFFGFPPHSSHRLSAFYSGPIVGHVLAPIAVIASATMLFYGIKKPINQLHWLYGGLILLLPLWFIAILLSGDRAAMVIFITAHCLIYLFWVRFAPIKLSLYFLCGAFTGLIVLIFNPQLFMRHVISIINQIIDLNKHPFTDSSPPTISSAYGDVYHSAILTIQEHWLFGLGMKHFRSECVEVNTPCYLHPHNIYLESWAEFGIIGFILLCALLLILLKQFWSLRYLNFINPYYMGCFAFFCVKIFPLLPTSSLRSSWGFMIFWLVVGWLLSMQRQKDTS